MPEIETSAKNRYERWYREVRSCSGSVFWFFRSVGRPVGRPAGRPPPPPPQVVERADFKYSTVFNRKKSILAKKHETLDSHLNAPQATFERIWAPKVATRCRKLSTLNVFWSSFRRSTGTVILTTLPMRYSIFQGCRASPNHVFFVFSFRLHRGPPRRAPGVDF